MGNLVTESFETDLVSQIQSKIGRTDTQSSFDIDVYWNGSNGRGMTVAPGMYRAIVYVDYADNANYRDYRQAVNLGIGR